MTEPYFNLDDLASRGFEGFVPLRGLPRRPATIPSAPGVYAVLRAAGAPVEFLDESVGGRHKGRDPRVATSALNSAWIDGVETVYLGKSENLRRRLDEFARFGRGEPIGHYGGRYIWQLSDNASLLVCWHVDDEPEAYEALLIGEFCSRFGSLPFANLNRPLERRTR